MIQGRNDRTLVRIVGRINFLGYKETLKNIHSRALTVCKVKRQATLIVEHVASVRVILEEGVNQIPGDPLFTSDMECQFIPGNVHMYVHGYCSMVGHEECLYGLEGGLHFSILVVSQI